MILKIQRLRDGDRDIEPPAYQSEHAAGMDLRAAIGAPVVLAPGKRAKIPTGFAFELPVGFEGQIRPRSGLADKHGLTVVNAPGTLDADYRGEVCVLLVNLGEVAFEIRRGERIAQLVVAPVTHARVELVDALTETARGAGGFGSSGKR